tara:strand:+ start:127 stop:1245 length:1119 start_codon:yes stop_codon:yes gene_type:complete
MASKARQLAQSASAPEGRKNILINGAKEVFQRSTSASAVTTDIYSAPDRWKTRVGDTSEFTISQSSTTPDGFANSTKWDCTTANTSLSSGSFIIYEQRIEAQDLQHLQYGTSSAKAITVSFHVRSNKTGVYTVGLFANDGNRQIESSYTINSADTFEKKTITFPGDTGGTINDDNGEGLRVWFWLGGGTNFSSGTQATSWAAYDATQVLADNQVNLADSTSNEWYITGVQLEVGSVATEFEHQKYCDVYKDCQRYYYKSGDNSPSSEEWFTGVATNAGRGFYYALGLDGINDRAYPALQWPVQMRAAPSVTFYPGRNDVTNTADRIVPYNGTDLITYTSSPTPYSNGITGIFLGTSVDSVAYAYQIIADAEL